MLRCYLPVKSEHPNSDEKLTNTLYRFQAEHFNVFIEIIPTKKNNLKTYWTVQKEKPVELVQLRLTVDTVNNGIISLIAFDTDATPEFIKLLNALAGKQYTRYSLQMLDIEGNELSIDNSYMKAEVYPLLTTNAQNLKEFDEEEDKREIDRDIDTQMITKEDVEFALAEAVNVLIDLILSKNADYGNSFFLLREEYGFKATLIRLTDKLNRLKTLEQKIAQVDESIEDTLKDLAGYVLLEMAYRKLYE